MDSQKKEFWSEAKPITAEAASGALSVCPDQWDAVDMKGRTLPGYEAVGGKRKKTVGLFYWTWHYPNAQRYPARNNTQLLKTHPEAVNDFSHPLWENTPSGTPYYWDEPLFGYYQNLDEYVIRKHAEMLADAGIDVIFFDCTNGNLTWRPAYLTLCKVFLEAREEGVKVPGISFMLNFCPAPTTREMLHVIYDDFSTNEAFRSLLFPWQGKPVIMAHQQCLDPQDPKEKKILDFFTYKNNEPTYFAADTPYEANRWGWCSVYPQTKFGVRADGGVEQMTVNVAQNANDSGLNAMNANGGVGTYGRSYTKGDFSYEYRRAGQTVRVDASIPDSCLYGLNFQQEWEYALSVDPDFIFITGWNEWIAGRHNVWEGTENAFPDQFDYERSRDAEPSRGILKDMYYYQMVANIRRYKGMCEPAATDCRKTIDIEKGAEQWKEVRPEFAHYIGSTKKRDADGWVGLHYTGKAVRNDVVLAKAAYDRDFVYFLAETAEPLTPQTDECWMRLLIDTDSDGLLPNWESFTYIINRVSPTGGKATVEKSLGGFHWEKSGEADLCVSGRILQLRVPRAALGFTPGDGEIHFRFKWADDNLRTEDIMELYTDGEAAPEGRFTFHI